MQAKPNILGGGIRCPNAVSMDYGFAGVSGENT